MNSFKSMLYIISKLFTIQQVQYTMHMRHDSFSRFKMEELTSGDGNHTTMPNISQNVSHHFSTYFQLSQIKL